MTWKKHEKSIPILILGFLLFGGTSIFADFKYIVNKCPKGKCKPSISPVTDIPKPDKGVSYQDSVFHTTITRITGKDDGVIEVWKGSQPMKPGRLVPEYSRIDAENADSSKLIITYGEGSLFLYDAKTLQFIKGLTTLNGGIIPENFPKNLEPRWDAENPDVFYYVYKMGFYRYNIQTDTISLIHDFTAEFPDGSWVTTNMEGEPSKDSRHWAFAIRRGRPDYAHIAVVTYDLLENKIIGKMDHQSTNWPDCSPYHPHCDLNTLAVSPLGDRVVIEWGWQSKTGKSTWTYNLHFTEPVALGNDGHSDLALTADGSQVHVIKDDSNDVIAMLDINTGKRTNLLTLPLSGDKDEWGKGDYHISGNNYELPGWVVVSTFGDTDKFWHHYQVFLVELKKNPRIWQIAQTHGKYGGSHKYWSESQASINKKGTRIYWRSNWGNENGDVDTYCASLPPTWFEDLGGNRASSK